MSSVLLRNCRSGCKDFMQESDRLNPQEPEEIASSALAAAPWPDSGFRASRGCECANRRANWAIHWKSGTDRTASKDGSGVFADVGRDAQLRARAHDPGQEAQCFWRHQPALGVALLGPGVWKQDERARDGGLGQPAQQRPRIVGMHADIGRASWSSIAASTLTTPSSNGSQPMRVNVRVLLGLPDQMLAAAEADLEPCLWWGQTRQGLQRTFGNSSVSNLCWRGDSLRPRLRP